VSAQENEALVRRYFEEGWVKGNLAAVDEFMAPNYVEHLIPDGQFPGRESFKQLLAVYYIAFPDLKSVLHDILAQGDRVAFRWSVSGTHLGEWAGIPPTGLHMTAAGITIYRIAAGKAVEGWASIDISRSAEEQRWLSEGGRTDESHPERGDITPATVGPEHSPVNDALIRNLTWRLRAAEAQERERIEQELQFARRIQEELLPEAMPTLDRWEFAQHYQPAREVGGDFYDFLELEGERLGLVVGDATGKGVPAALVMAAARSMLHAVSQSSDSPGDVLARVNDALCSDIPDGMFVTCFYGILDPESGRFLYANAGHNLPCCRRHDGQADELRARGMPLGIMRRMDYEEKETMLEAGESTLFYSDGLVEAHDPQREMFGFPRLRKLVAEHAEQGSLVEFLIDELRSFTGDSWEQEDDITLLTLERTATRS
jgi:serine phosphatase RsbU (regulator of sigma subunit)/predicted ester cyclase